MEKKQIRIISIVLGTIIGLLIIFFGFRIMQKVFTRAADIAPRDVVVSDISNNSTKITWSTDQEAQGVVEYGTSPTSLNFFAPESKKTKNHTVELTLLSPNSTYYFQIRIGDKKFDNGGVPWTFTTKSTSAQSGTQPGNTLPTQKPTPISKVVIEQPTTAPTAAPQAECSQTDCDKIKEKLGKGCSMSDYIKNNCLSASSTTTATPTTAPTSTPSAAIAP